MNLEGAAPRTAGCACCGPSLTGTAHSCPRGSRAAPCALPGVRSNAGPRVHASAVPAVP